MTGCAPWLNRLLQDDLSSWTPPELAALDSLTAPAPADRYRADPSLILADAGMPPDPWQTGIMRSADRRLLLLCSRQAGKSTAAAALSLAAALTEPSSLVLLLSPTLRQSGELFRKLAGLYDALGRPVGQAARTALTLELANGSRVVSLPENEAGVRGYSGVRLLVIDEASRVGDDLYHAVRPMLAVSGGGLVALSTPFGKRGWFFEEWEKGPDWRRVKVTAPECPRIGPEFLAKEEAASGRRWFRQEYLCEFEAAVDAVYDPDDVDAAVRRDVAPLFA